MRNKHILHVEDDENDIFFLKHAFDKAGILSPMHIAKDGQQAVDYLAGVGKFSDRSSHPLPWLIILDLKLPRKSGIEVLKWLRADSGLPILPVLILSSSGQSDDVDQAYALGANCFVVKPSSVSERVRLAGTIKEFWLGFNRPPSECSPEI